MICDDFKELSNKSPGEWSRAERMAWQNHQANCQNCREWFNIIFPIPVGGLKITNKIVELVKDDMQDPEFNISVKMNAVDLIINSGRAVSKAEARRLIMQGGLKVNGVKIIIEEGDDVNGLELQLKRDDKVTIGRQEVSLPGEKNG